MVAYMPLSRGQGTGDVVMLKMVICYVTHLIDPLSLRDFTGSNLSP